MDKITFWIFSDTHNNHSKLDVPKNVDIAIFAGDAGYSNSLERNIIEVSDFLDWYKTVDIPHKVAIFGNHDVSTVHKVDVIKETYPEITFLNHEEYIHPLGFSMFGSPYSPMFMTNQWAYQRNRSKMDKLWKDVPTNIDILLTHCPPQGILDMGVTWKEKGHSSVRMYTTSGDKALLRHVKEKKLKIHIFGHIHSIDNINNSGIYIHPELNTLFINASVVDYEYKLINSGIVLEVLDINTENMYYKVLNN